jgi:hypothetical protein
MAGLHNRVVAFSEKFDFREPYTFLLWQCDNWLNLRGSSGECLTSWLSMLVGNLINALFEGLGCNRIDLSKAIEFGPRKRSDSGLGVCVGESLYFFGSSFLPLINFLMFA